MTRFPDWPERWNAFVEERRNRPFQWGANDCGLFAADAVLAVTGTDIAKDWRGYRTERGALNRVKKVGGMRHFLTLPEKHIGLAQRCDMVLVDLDGRETFGIVDIGRWFGPGEHGMLSRPLDDHILAAFQV